MFWVLSFFLFITKKKKKKPDKACLFVEKRLKVARQKTAEKNGKVCGI